MELIFRLADDYVIVKIKNGQVLFSNSNTNFQRFVPIDGIMLNREGIIKEFPDLKGLPDSEMRKEAIDRFKKHIKEFNTEDEIKEYIIMELKKYGYICEKIKKEGFRAISLR